jgi:hypothetical protein
LLLVSHDRDVLAQFEKVQRFTAMNQVVHDEAHR